MASILPKKTHRFECNNSNFIIGNKKCVTRHLLTSKHKNASKCYENASKLPINKNYYVCCKEYKDDYN